MTKYFKAKVVLQRTVEVNVAAADEASAKVKATELAVQQDAIGSHVSQVVLIPDGETEYGVGVRVKHFLFGAGEIVELCRTTNYKNDIGFRATIKFDTGDTRDLSLPMGKDKLEVISA